MQRMTRYWISIDALDRTYYQTLPTSNNFGGLFYGEPRNFAVTLRYQY